MDASLDIHLDSDKEGRRDKLVAGGRESWYFFIYQSIKANWS